MEEAFWRDRDRRRAFMLSLLLHLSVLLLFVWVWTLPQPVPPETYLVIDIGEPMLAETETLAPAAEESAPQTSEPQVAAPQAGEPVASAPPAPMTTEPEPVAQAEPAPAAEPEPESVAEPEPESVAEPEPVTEPEPTPEPVAEPEPEPVAEPDPEPVAEPAPQPPPAAPPVSAATEAETPPDDLSATTLPEIDEPDVSVTPLAEAVTIPRPLPEVSVAPARTVALSPSASVAPQQAVPTPTVAAQVEAAQAVPVPQVSAATPSPRPVPTPQVSASLAPPQVVPTPSPSASVLPPRSVPRPPAQAQVGAARAVPTPAPQAQVSPAQAVPTPAVQAQAAPARSVPSPGVSASVAAGQSVSVAPQASVGAAQAVPVPQVSAAVRTPASGQVGTAAGEAASAGQDLPRDPGGNAAASGQTTAQPGASEANLGLAAGPTGSAAPTGAPAARAPFRDTLSTPLAVMVDNARGYPQMGLLEAALVVEMPVEGGLTRLMTVYTRLDPGQVGPVRSAREYFFELAQGMAGVLVHDGGSPAALAAIARADLPTLNSFSSGELFSRAADRDAPYNLYSRGAELRRTMRQQLGMNATRAVSGTIYRPEPDALSAATVSLRYSGAYSSAFRYVRDLNRYRWVRNGTDAVDASGQAIYADAVLVAQVEARPIPDDPEGRLYLPVRGGPATLYLRGQAVPGRWENESGLRFVTSLGEIVDLAPFKVWAAFTPVEAEVN